MEKKVILFEIICIVIFSILFGTAAGGSLFFPDYNFIDEGQFAAWANHMILGKLMYQDIYITYGPLFVYPIYILFKLFTPSLFVVRAYMLIGFVLSLIVMLLLMYHLRIHRMIRYLLLTIMILLPIIQLRQGIALLSIYMLMLAIKKGGNWWYFLVGVTSALTFLVSPDMGIFVLLLEGIVFAFSLAVSKKPAKVLQNSFKIFFGYSIVTFIFSLWASNEGWLIAYLRTTADLFSTFSGINLPNGMGFPNLFHQLPQNLGILALGKYIFSKEALLYWGVIFYIVTLLYIVITALRSNIRTVGDVILLFLFGFFMYSILIGRWGTGHFFFILPPILLLAGYYSSRIGELDKKTLGDRMVAVGLLAILAFFAARIIFINHPQIAANFTALNAHLDNSGGITAQQKYIASVLSFVDTNLTSGDTIYIVSNEPALYMLMNKTNPTRYDLPYIVTTKDKRYEVLESLMSNPPTYVFENTQEWAVDGIPNRERMPEVSNFIKQNYHEINDLNGLRIYKFVSS